MANGAMLDEEGLIGLVQGLDPKASGAELLDDLYWRLTQGMPEGAEMADDVSATLLEFHVDGSAQEA
jgi:sigma-B regulation protein RsbU (phosphoserine phosphatase)